MHSLRGKEGREKAYCQGIAFLACSVEIPLAPRESAKVLVDGRQ